MELLSILLSGLVVNNFVMSRFLGICPFLGVSKKIETAFGMGVAVTFVMSISSVICYFVFNLILVPLEVTYLYNVTFILVIASFVQMLEAFIKKYSTDLYNALGVYLPLITTNCAVLGVVVINMNEEYTLAKSFVNAFGAAVGFTIAIVIFAGIRTRFEHNDVPESFKGFPIAMIAAGLMSIAFFGFQGLI